MGTIKAHIFKERQVGGREEVKIKLFDLYGVPIDISGDTELDPDNSTLPQHVNSETPHPVYDDGPSLTLLYANAKV